MKKANPIIIFTVSVILLALVAVLIGRSLLQDPDTPAWNQTQETDGTPHTEETEQTEPLLRDMPGHKPTVVLDAGHGFGDVGCAGPETALGAYEYQVTMDMVNSLKADFEAAGVRVFLTHDANSFPSTAELAKMCKELGVEYDETKSTWVDDNKFAPYERVIYMNILDKKYGVDFALSIHVNANVDSDKLNGFDLDYCTENDWSADSRVYAEGLKTALEKQYPGRNLWYYEDSFEDAFIVTKYNTMPSALLETGYYTNAADAALLRDKNWRDTLMDTVCNAVCEVIK